MYQAKTYRRGSALLGADRAIKDELDSLYSYLSEHSRALAQVANQPPAPVGVSAGTGSYVQPPPVSPGVTLSNQTPRAVSLTAGIAGGSDEASRADHAHLLPTVDVPHGGTGLTTVSQGGIPYGSAADTYSILAKDANATRYLSNQGTSNNPSWNQVNLANGVTGVLPYSNGGTDQSTWAAGDLLYASATNVLSKRTIGSTGDVLTVSGGVPVWAANASALPSGTTGQTLYYSGTNTVAASSVLLNDGTNAKFGAAVVPTATNAVGLAVKGLSSQTADLQQWQKTGGTVMGGVTKDGYAYLGTTVPTTGTGALLIDAVTLGTALNANTPAIYVLGDNGNERVNLRSCGATPFAEFRGQGGQDTNAAPSALTTNDACVNLTGGGYAGATAGWVNAQGRVSIQAAETWTNTARGTFMRFLTTTIGATTLTERMRIFDNGRVAIGQSTDPGVTLRTQGFGMATATKTNDYTMTGADAVIHCARNATPKVITLPTAANAQIVYIIATGTTGTLTISRAGSDTITTAAGTTGQTTISVAANTMTILVSDGTSVWQAK